MANPMYTTDYMKRVAFVDGQVLHDNHLNLMQQHVAETIKMKTTRERYDLYLLVSPYEMSFHDPLVSEEFKAESSTAILNTLTFSFSSGSWESTLLQLPEPTDEIYLVSNFEDYPQDGANVNFYYRTAIENEWIPIHPDKPEYLVAPKKNFQIKIECHYTGVVRPIVYDYALLWRQEE